MREFKVHDIQWTDEVVSRLWDHYSKTYPFNQQYFTRTVGKDILHHVTNIIGSLDDKVILDFGCGPAFFIEYLVDLGMAPAKYIGLDFSKDSVASMDKRGAGNFVTEGLYTQKLPTNIEGGSIDICFLMEVIEHLNDEHLSSTLNEIHRVLKPGGVLVITTPNDEDLELSTNFCPECGCVYHKWQHEKKFDTVSLVEVVRAFRFKPNVILELKLKDKDYDYGVLQALKRTVKKIIRYFNKEIKEDKPNLFGVFTK